MARTSEKEQADVRVWRARLERSKDRRQKNLDEWNKNLAYYTEGHDGGLGMGEHENEVVINKVFATLRAQLPGLIFNRPKFDVTPRRPVDRGGVNIAPELARGKEHMLNYFWSELDGQFHARMAVLSAFMAIGVVKVGYTPHFEDNPKAGKLKQDEDGNYTLNANGLPALEQGDFIRDEKGRPVIDPDTGIPLLEPGELLRNEHFFVEWVHWKNMLFDPEGTNDFTQHAWVAEEWVRPTREVKADRLFHNRTLIQPSEFIDGGGKNPSMLGVDRDSFTFEEQAVREDEARTRGYTIYDLKKRQIMVIIDSPPNGAHDFMLRKDPMPAEQEHGPYVFLRFNEVPGRWEPLPDITPLRSPQDEINLLRSKVLTHIQRADRKYLYDEAAFESEDELQKLMGGGDMTMVPSSNLAAVQALPLATMDPAVYAAVPDVDRTFDELSGQPAEARGVAKADTATQASIMENHNQMRQSDRRDNIIHNFVRDVGRKLLQSMQANLTQPIWVAAGDSTLPNPFEGFVEPSDLVGEADVGIEVGSMLPKTNSVLRQQFQQLLQILSGAPFLASSPKLLARIFEMFEIEDTGMAQEIAALAQQQNQQEGGGQQAAPPGQVASMPGLANGSSPVAGVAIPTVGTRQ